MASRTRVLVTHNVSFLPRMDQIVMLKEGTIAEKGTYEELVTKRGAFAELVRQLEQQEQVSTSGYIYIYIQGVGLSLHCCVAAHSFARAQEI